MIGIYRITNKITSKHYIGQSVNIQRRFAEHCRRNEECEPKDLNQKEDL